MEYPQDFWDTAQAQPSSERAQAAQRAVVGELTGFDEENHGILGGLSYLKNHSEKNWFWVN